MRALIQSEDLADGIWKKNPAKPVEREELQGLRRVVTYLKQKLYHSNIDGQKAEKAITTLRGIENQLNNMYRDWKPNMPTETADLALIKEGIRIAREQLRLEDEFRSLNEQIRGEIPFEQKLRAERKDFPPELENQKIVNRRMQKFIDMKIRELQPKTTLTFLDETINTLRTIKATGDFSATLRQGMIQAFSHPIKASDAFAQSVHAFFSKYKAEQIDLAIRSADNFYIKDRSGLFIADEFLGKEEMFMSRWVDAIPGFKHIVKASERQMVSYLNLMRVTAFDTYYFKYPHATQEELSAWANWINVSTGRGDLNAGAASFLQYGFFAPRFAMSRAEAPFMALKHWKHPRVRKMIMRDQLKALGVGMMAINLAKWGGAEVGDDPRDSDWGKIVIGNTRFDIWGGHQQPMRFLWEVATIGTDKVGFTGGWINESENETPADLLARFAEFKMAPHISVTSELLSGKSVVGEEVGIGTFAAHTLMPLAYQDAYDAAKLDGWGMGFGSAGAGLLGVGASTYETSKSKVKRKIRRELWLGEDDEADRLRNDWNTTHPVNDRIDLDFMIRNDPELKDIMGLEAKIKKEIKSQ
jgi:hypothetical protein